MTSWEEREREKGEREREEARISLSGGYIDGVGALQRAHAVEAGLEGRGNCYPEGILAARARVDGAGGVHAVAAGAGRRYTL